MTTVLNRKFDVLARSGTCPPYLLDVLSLLVAHANDTELYKSEMRSAPFSSPAMAEGEKMQMAQQREELQLVEATLEHSVKASHETILLAAEQSLRTYAEDLRNINEAAVAATAKELRELRTRTRQEMSEFRDQVCEATVKRSARDLEVLHGEWIERIRAETNRLKNEIDSIAMNAQRAITEKAEEYARFVAEAHAVLNVQPALDAHVALTASSLATEQVALLSASTAPRADVDLLAERLKQAERAVARMWANLYDGEGASPTSSPSTAAPPAAPQRSQQTPPRPVQHGASSPEATLSVAGASARPAAPAAAADDSYTDEGGICVIDALGIAVEMESGGDGVLVVEVGQHSPAAAAGVRSGFIISHVERTAVYSPEEMQQAVDNAETEVNDQGGAVRLTVYDPEAGRVRILSVHC